MEAWARYDPMCQVAIDGDAGYAWGGLRIA
jgi:hypothetical protein